MNKNHFTAKTDEVEYLVSIVREISDRHGGSQWLDNIIVLLSPILNFNIPIANGKPNQSNINIL